jgi:hypothetical protein
MSTQATTQEKIEAKKKKALIDNNELCMWRFKNMAEKAKPYNYLKTFPISLAYKN